MSSPPKKRSFSTSKKGEIFGGLCSRCHKYQLLRTAQAGPALTLQEAPSSQELQTVRLPLGAAPLALRGLTQLPGGHCGPLLIPGPGRRSLAKS